MEGQSPYGLIESWLLSYSKWKTKIEALQFQLMHIPGLTQRFELAAIHGKGQKNEAILHEVMKRTEIQDHELPVLENRIHLLDISFKVLTPKERELVQIRYLNQLASSLTMEYLNMSPKVYYRKRIKILNMIYEAMGREKCLSVFEDHKVES
ncbi:MAG TPA: hypothetical protein VGE40_00825 [Bacilli bacterium]